MMNYDPNDAIYTYIGMHRLLITLIVMCAHIPDHMRLGSICSDYYMIYDKCHKLMWWNAVSTIPYAMRAMPYIMPNDNMNSDVIDVIPDAMRAIPDTKRHEIVQCYESWDCAMTWIERHCVMPWPKDICDANNVIYMRCRAIIHTMPRL